MKTAKRSRDAFAIGGKTVAAGARARVDIPVADLHTGTTLTMPVHVLHGAKDGPRLFLSAAVHGDELNGVEIIRRVLQRRELQNLRGTIVAVPIVNVFGLVNGSRYLPDRRDLNRSFPGSEKGSLAARLAHLFLNEVAGRCTHGIDLHTGARDRTNLPQTRLAFDDDEARRMAEAFGAPVAVDSPVRDGSLRGEAAARGIHVVLFEGGEALRFDEWAIRPGVAGVLRVMRHLDMLRKSKGPSRPPPVLSTSSSWIRAPESGLLRLKVRLGQALQKGEELGDVVDLAGEMAVPIRATFPGVIIGLSNLPLVHEGDALVHVARTDAEASERVERITHSNYPLPGPSVDDDQTHDEGVS